MLVSCGDCGNQVSDKAPACPKCGAPVATAAAGVGVQTVEATAKRFKGVQLLGGLMLAASCPAVMTETSGGMNGGATVGVLLFVVGGLVYFGGRMSAWWNHG